MKKVLLLLLIIVILTSCAKSDYTMSVSTNESPRHARITAMAPDVTIEQAVFVTESFKILVIGDYEQVIPLKYAAWRTHDSSSINLSEIKVNSSVSRDNLKAWGYQRIERTNGEELYLLKVKGFSEEIKTRTISVTYRAEDPPFYSRAFSSKDGGASGYEQP